MHAHHYPCILVRRQVNRLQQIMLPMRLRRGDTKAGCRERDRRRQACEDAGMGLRRQRTEPSAASLFIPRRQPLPSNSELRYTSSNVQITAMMVIDVNPRRKTMSAIFSYRSAFLRERIEPYDSTLAIRKRDIDTPTILSITTRSTRPTFQILMKFRMTKHIPSRFEDVGNICFEISLLCRSDMKKAPGTYSILFEPETQKKGAPAKGDGHPAPVKVEQTLHMVQQGRIDVRLSCFVLAFLPIPFEARDLRLMPFAVLRTDLGHLLPAHSPFATGLGIHCRIRLASIAWSAVNAPTDSLGRHVIMSLRVPS
jgi:hypothetical protein